MVGPPQPGARPSACGLGILAEGSRALARERPHLSEPAAGGKTRRYLESVRGVLRAAARYSRFILAMNFTWIDLGHAAIHS